jgi:hypothetical protein
MGINWIIKITQLTPNKIAKEKQKEEEQMEQKRVSKIRDFNLSISFMWLNANSWNYQKIKVLGF